MTETLMVQNRVRLITGTDICYIAVDQHLPFFNLRADIELQRHLFVSGIGPPTAPSDYAISPLHVTLLAAIGLSPSTQ